MKMIAFMTTAALTIAFLPMGCTTPGGDKRVPSSEPPSRETATRQLDTVRFAVYGMTCEDCSDFASKSLRDLPGEMIAFMTTAALTIAFLPMGCTTPGGDKRAPSSETPIRETATINATTTYRDRGRHGPEQSAGDNGQRANPGEDNRSRLAMPSTAGPGDTRDRNPQEHHDERSLYVVVEHKAHSERR